MDYMGTISLSFKKKFIIFFILFLSVYLVIECKVYFNQKYIFLDFFYFLYPCIKTIKNLKILI